MILLTLLLVTVTLVNGGPAHHHDHHVHVHDNHEHVHDDREHVYDDDEDYDGDEDDTVLDYETVYDAIRDELPELLTQVERRYKTHIQHHQEDGGVSPLLSLFSQEPHSMTIMMNPSKMEPKIKVGCW